LAINRVIGVGGVLIWTVASYSRKIAGKS